jgi:hypothetical protein
VHRGFWLLICCGAACRCRVQLRIHVFGFEWRMVVMEHECSAAHLHHCCCCGCELMRLPQVRVLLVSLLRTALSAVIN